MKKIYIIVIIIGILMCFYGFRKFIKYKQHNYVISNLTNNIKYSNVLEENICKIIKISPSDSEWFKKYDNSFYFKNFLVFCENNDTIIIKVIVKDDALDVVAYEINGELFYETDEIIR